MADRANSSTERITVTYAASQALLAAPLTPHFLHLLKEQLPLRNLHWRPSQSTLDAVAARAASQGKTAQQSSSVVPGSTIRTIQTLDVALKPLTDEIRRMRGDPGYFDQPGTAALLDRPFVHLYLVVCEDSEHYRTTVRNEIRSWISSLSFFAAKQSSSSQDASSVGTSNFASSSKTSLALGSLRSATPPVRSETPPATSSGANTPTTQSGSTRSASTSTAAPAGPTEPEYLIVLITPPEGAGIAGTGGAGATGADAKSGMSRFMNKSKGNVLEKARADFNTSKKEHVVQLSRLPPVPAAPLSRPGLHSMDPTIWAELLTKMREAASSTFTTTVEAQEHEIARCGITRGQQGWDFCSYFLAKDSLARTLEAVGLKDDAVGQYEDLEVVFGQAMQSGAVSFAPIGGDDENDDSLPLLDVNKKPYAELIRRREISLFDFRCYLFARKAALLGKMGRVAAVMREAPLFISAVGRMLRRNGRLGSQFVESWIFSAALDVVEQCQAWLIQRGGQSVTAADDQLSPAFHSNKSELLDVARRQLDRMGIEAGHLPASEPFAYAVAGDTLETSMSTVSKERDLPPLPDAADETAVDGLGLGPAAVVTEKRGSSRPELQQAVASREHFDSHYLALCERILSGWKVASRTRDALHVRTILATLHYLRGKYQIALDSLPALTEEYACAKFALLERHALSMQLECYAKLNKPRDRAWIAAALAALNASVRAPGSSSNLEVEASKWTDPGYLCDQLRTASSALGKEVPISGFPLFSIVLPSASAKLAGTEDGSLLEVDVTSLLPCKQVVEDVRVCLVTGGGETFWFTSSRTEIGPGTTRVELFCPHPAHGVYTVDVTQIRIARVIFQYEHGTTAEPLIVRVLKDGSAPSVAVGLPRRIDLDRRREIELTVRSGRNDIEVAEVSVTSSGGSALVDYKEAKLSEDGAVSGTTLVGNGVATASSVSITTLRRGTSAVILLPLLQLPESGVLDATVTLNYTSPPSGSQRHASGKKRTLKVPVQLRTALPLGVNVQDFFRTSCLLSKFTISAGGGGSLRLQPVTLLHDEDASGEGETAYKVDSCGSTREATVTPRQPATYLFRVSKGGAGRVEGGKGGMRLTVRYRGLQEDAIEAMGRALDVEIERSTKRKGLESGTANRRLLEDALGTYLRERLDLPAFSITGQVRTGALDRQWWRRERRSWGQCNLTLDELVELVRASLDGVSTGVQAAATEEEIWQTLTIPVDVPSVDYVNAVTLSLGSASAVVTGAESNSTDPTSVIVGQPVDLILSINTSTAWSTSSHDDGETMVYDVVPDFETWLVDGSKRGTFPVKRDPLSSMGKSGTFSVTLTVVPLRTGSLALPSVQVRPMSALMPTRVEEGGRVPTCETYVTNAGQRVDVVPARSVTAFLVPIEGATSGAGRDSWTSKGGVGMAGLDRVRSAWQSQQYLHAG
ncbi:ER to Golgi transport-related protein [Pseudozyma hubeiensis]|nr:ER to Golgi transport-related protein [Pseudozyma hubeiensis]